ncbi:hypothetical protein GCM10011504_55090 [Siccirubricoccus deserti]|uniref:Uncharacterized protein n=1 Tax=Siccirubricoccus deserti TaxID=2013562 RepID=A0A9X0R3D0_9PROT|nr:hypothetical protein [Siccirubricoccus deserti]MBC4019019.1 hypothetical protein [Siccirubricoccus deserti]GGC70268.1 hypothetical protein GCM10011504_55090 [Siccirubricoccus deserti]
MALLGFEGFDAYGDVTQLGQQLSLTTTGGAYAAIKTTTPRTGRACMTFRMVVNGPGGTVRQSFTLSGTTVIVGVAVRWLTFPLGTVRPRVRLWSSGTSRSGMAFGVNSSGNLYVGLGGPTTVTGLGTDVSTTLWTNTGEIEPLNSWIYYELKVSLTSTTAGSWSLRRNGQVVQAQSGVATLVNAADAISAVIVEIGIAGSTLPYIDQHFDIDDLYVCDGSGSALNDFLGSVRVRSLKPTANNSVAMTPNTGTNWAAVADATPDDDTTVVSAASASLTDTYAIEDLPASAAIVRALRAIYRVRKEDASAVETTPVLISSGVTATGNLDAPDTTYRYFVSLFPIDPATGVAWTPAAVNSLLAGVRRVA